MPTAKKTTRRKKKGAPAPAPAPEPRGLEASMVAADSPPASIERLTQAIAADGGTALSGYRDPLGGHWQLLAALPLEKVEPTPYQRDLSQAHVGRLASAIDRLGRFLDPVIAVRTEDGRYWTPNGNHRVAALKSLGARSIVVLVVPEPEVAHRILLLNTEKAHNLRERALEVIRLAQGLVDLDDRPEREFEAEFEEAALLTLGLCYQKNGRFSGAVYHPVLRRTEAFMTVKLSKALEVRAEHAKAVMELNDAVEETVKRLKERGFESPYLKAFVVARVNPLRFQRKATAVFDETIQKMLAGVKKFDAGKVKPDQLARAGGPPEETG
ncbi:MAG: ParB N-terminal domain-containing protein [Gemmatimonadetes bacterium]|nr:ParB N-terminal domain-containing protein [Gemmatimonadota bacterium]